MLFFSTTIWIKIMNEQQLRKRLAELNINTQVDDLNSRAHLLEKILKIILKPKTQSDRTAFRNVRDWYFRKCEGSGLEYESFRCIVDFALEASGPESRKPAAVFMYILKKELNYPN